MTFSPAFLGRCGFFVRLHVGGFTKVLDAGIASVVRLRGLYEFFLIEVGMRLV